MARHIPSTSKESILVAKMHMARVMKAGHAPCLKREIGRKNRSATWGSLSKTILLSGHLEVSPVKLHTMQPTHTFVHKSSHVHSKSENFVCAACRGNILNLPSKRMVMSITDVQELVSKVPSLCVFFCL